MTDAEAKRILNQLEKSVGKGNFDVLFGEEDDEMDFDDVSDEEWDEDFDDMEYDEKIALFRELTANGSDELPDDAKRRLIALTDSIYFMDICDEDEASDLMDSWGVEADITIDAQTFTAELLSQESGLIISEDEELELDQIDLLMDDKPHEFEKHLHELKKKWGNIPYLNYKELKYLELNKSNEYEKKRSECLSQFANYPLFKLEGYKYKLLNSEKSHELEIIDFEDVFEGRDSITEAEMFEFQMMKFLILIARGNLNEIEAMYGVLDDLDLSEEYYKYLKTIMVFNAYKFIGKVFRCQIRIMIYQFKIQLKGVSDPTVWRRIQLDAGCTFEEFHRAIQYAFGWEFSHLYFFSPTGYNSKPMIEPSCEGYEMYEMLDEESLDADTTLLSDIFVSEKMKFTYLYDTGDDWKHQISLEKILKDIVIGKPLLLKGEGACPPEDCGGSWGYEALKETLADKMHPEHKEMKEWLGMRPKDNWDAAAFDIEARQKIINQNF